MFHEKLHTHFFINTCNDRVPGENTPVILYLRYNALNNKAEFLFQHEYDHIEGKLFTDKLSTLKKTMLKSKLDAISKGNIRVGYKMRFPQQKKKR